MLTKIRPVLLLPVLLLISGCQATFTNLTPQHQERNPNNLYPVEVSLNMKSKRGDFRLTVKSSEADPMRGTSVTFAMRGHP